MRNLKRALSLTLASVMLLGMMVVGAGAASYPDVDESNNIEAIEVLQAVKVMEGDSAGNFDPDRPVSRAEMAVIMALLLNLDYDYYRGTKTFSDVPNWCAPYVAACYANGIISGYNATTYGSADTVNAVQAASMMMRALGYFKFSSDYEGDFVLSTVKQASKIELFKGINANSMDPLTRNQVAQLALNALKTPIVEPDDNTITIKDANGNIIATGGQVNYVVTASSQAYARAIDDAESKGTALNGVQGYIIELGEKLYNGDLRLNDNRRDVFGRPARNWEYKGDNVGTYAKKEILREEYTEEVTGRQLYDLLGSNTVENYPVFKVFVDGVDDWDASNQTAFDRSAVNRTNNSGVGGTGRGVLTQVYVDTDTKEVTVAIINTYLAFTDEDYDDRTDDIDITVYGIREYNSSDEYYKSANTADGVSTDESFKLDVKDFPEVANMKKDQPLLVRVAQGAVQDLSEPEVLSAVKISSFKQGNWVVSGGTQYDFASATEYECETLEDYTDTIINLKDIDYNIYLDQYDNLIGVVEVEAPNNYVFITGVDTYSNNRFNATIDATGIFVDGTMDSSIVINYNKCSSEAKAELESGVKGGHMINKWYTYTKDSNDRYVLNAIEVNGAAAGDRYVTSAADANVNALTGKVAQAHTKQGAGVAEVKEVNKKSIALRGGATSGKWSKVYGNEGSVYIIPELTEILTANGVTRAVVISGVEDVVTGVDNANITLWADSVIEKTKSGGNTDVELRTDASINVDGTDGRHGTYDDLSANGVYTLFDENGYVIAAVVIGEDEGAATNLVYAHTNSLESESDNNASARAAQGGDYTWTRKVISNGEEITLTEVGSGLSELKKMNKYNWYEVKYNANGEVRKVEHVSTALVGNERVTAVSALDAAMADKDIVLLDTVSNTTTPNYELRTFYTDTTNDETGFLVNKDAKIVFIQTNNRKETVTYLNGADKLKDVVKKLNDNGAGYDFDVSAIMERYEATVVVVYDRIGTGNGGGRPTGDGIIGTPMGVMSTVAEVNAQLLDSDVTITGAWTPTAGGNVVIPANRTLKIQGDFNPTAGAINGDTISVTNNGANASLIVDGRYELNRSVSSAIQYDITADVLVFKRPASAETIAISADVNVRGDGTSGTNDMYVSGLTTLNIARGSTVIVRDSNRTNGSAIDAVLKIDAGGVINVLGDLTVNGSALTGTINVGSYNSLHVTATASSTIVLNAPATTALGGGNGYAEIGTLTGTLTNNNVSQAANKTPTVTTVANGGTVTGASAAKTAVGTAENGATVQATGTNAEITVAKAEDDSVLKATVSGSSITVSNMGTDKVQTVSGSTIKIAPNAPVTNSNVVDANGNKVTNAGSTGLTITGSKDTTSNGGVVKADQAASTGTSATNPFTVTNAHGATAGTYVTGYQAGTLPDTWAANNRKPVVGTVKLAGTMTNLIDGKSDAEAIAVIKQFTGSIAETVDAYKEIYEIEGDFKFSAFTVQMDDKAMMFTIVDEGDGWRIIVRNDIRPGASVPSRPEAPNTVYRFTETTQNFGTAESPVYYTIDISGLN